MLRAPSIRDQTFPHQMRVADSIAVTTYARPGREVTKMEAQLQEQDERVFSRGSVIFQRECNLPCSRSRARSRATPERLPVRLAPGCVRRTAREKKNRHIEWKMFIEQRRLPVTG